MSDSSIAYGLNVEIRPGTNACYLEVRAGDMLIDWFRGTRDEVLSRARVWFGEGGHVPGELGSEEGAYQDMTEMARWFAFDAPDNY